MQWCSEAESRVARGEEGEGIVHHHSGQTQSGTCTAKMRAGGGGQGLESEDGRKVEWACSLGPHSSKEHMNNVYEASYREHFSTKGQTFRDTDVRTSPPHE